MDLITLLVIVIILAVVFWLAGTYVAPLFPMPVGRTTLGMVIVGILALIVIIWLLSLFIPLGSIRVGRVG